jgi:uncharacterized protein YbaP (TraB family)
MKNYLKSSTLALVILIGLAACTPADKETHSAANASVAGTDAISTGPALWRLEDADTVVYLFGTVHVLKPDMEWETASFRSAFAQSDVIYQEADISPEIQQSLGAMLPGIALYTDGRTLRGVLNDADEKEVQEAADIVGLQMLTVDRMQPWFAAVNLSQMHMVQTGYRADSGVETVITGMAKEANKPIRFLETAEMQLRMLAGLPEDSQIEFLVAGAKAIEDTPEMLDELVDDWIEGDVAGIAELMSEEDAVGDRVVYDAMLTDRNRNWTREIQKLMDAEKGTFMIAVGAAHLAGDDSVIQMLEDQGETVTRQ